MSEIIKVCACGRQYIRGAWDRLPPCSKPGHEDGRVTWPWGEVTEQRNCPCGSTLTITVVKGSDDDWDPDSLPDSI